jgi:AraC-like DNA-binding protein
LINRSYDDNVAVFVSSRVGDRYVCELIRLISMTGEMWLPALLSWFIRKSCAAIPGAGTLVLSGREKAMEVVGYVMDCENHSAFPSVVALSRRFAVTPGALLRSFKEMFAMRLKAFIVGIKMEEARRLLALPGSSVTDVAYHLGYQSPYAFGTAFKKCFGYSPGKLLFVRRRSSVQGRRYRSSPEAGCHVSQAN